MKNLKIAFFGTPSLFLAAFLCLLLFFLIMWPPGPWCTVVEANFGGREGDRGQARPLARLCRPPTPPPTDLLDNPEVDLALAACRWPANSSLLSNFSSTSRSSSSFSYFFSSSMSMRSPLCSVHPAGLVRSSENHEGTFVTWHCRNFLTIV